VFTVAAACMATLGDWNATRTYFS